jgi:hypothetical protein
MVALRPSTALRGLRNASVVTVLVGVAVAATLTECVSDSSGPSDPTACGVYSGSPCVPDTLYPPNGVGCYGTVCPSGELCGGTGQPQFTTETFSCAPGPLGCGKELFTDMCTTDSDCPGMARCSAGVCYGTACPAGEQCSNLSLFATCQPSDAGASDAGPGVSDAGTSITQD